MWFLSLPCQTKIGKQNHFRFAAESLKLKYDTPTLDGRGEGGGQIPHSNQRPLLSCRLVCLSCQTPAAGSGSGGRGNLYHSVKAVISDKAISSSSWKHKSPLCSLRNDSLTHRQYERAKGVSGK